jgi:large subunit ribosomal protein L5
MAEYTPRLEQHFKDNVRGALKGEFSYKNDMQIPRLDKIVLNMGVGEAVSDSKKIRAAEADLALIAGQKPVVTKARQSIAGFKLREGMRIGVCVTLRRGRMWAFMERLLMLALPRVRDFRGVSPRAFDGAGNYTLGLKEQIVFPEIEFDRVDAPRGMNVTFVTTARTNEEGRELLKRLGMPFRN